MWQSMRLQRAGYDLAGEQQESGLAATTVGSGQWRGVGWDGGDKAENKCE